MGFLKTLISMDVEITVALALYVLSGALAIVHAVRRRGRVLRVAALAVLAAGLVANVLWIVDAWHTLGHPPFAEVYGCLVLLALCVGVVSLSLDVTTGIRFLGGVSSLSAAGILVFSVRYVADVRPLPPSLHSLYFAPHVLGYFIAYGALTLAGLAGLVFIVVRVARPRAKSRSPFLEGLRAWIHGAALVGFPFLTLGLLLGAFWAQASGGSYWSWDPKESWALVTWLLVVVWLHLWRQHSRGVPAAVVMVLAATALWFTFLGVGLLPAAHDSYHVYLAR